MGGYDILQVVTGNNSRAKMVGLDKVIDGYLLRML